jgi:hypothetical protein
VAAYAWRSVFIVIGLLVAPLLAAVLFWGSWLWVVTSVAVALVEWVALRRSQRFSARVWRNVRVGRRSTRERSIETVYVIAAVAGAALLVGAVLVRVWP